MRYHTQGCSHSRYISTTTPNIAQITENQNNHLETIGDFANIQRQNCMSTSKTTSIKVKIK